MGVERVREGEGRKGESEGGELQRRLGKGGRMGEGEMGLLSI